jgi:hypothetical protein
MRGLAIFELNLGRMGVGDMDFIITRTSNDFFANDKPCEGCRAVKANKIKDIRTFRDKAEWLQRCPRDEQGALEWGVTEDGKPYRIIECDRTLYIMDVPDIVEFARQHGGIIVSHRAHDSDYIGFEGYPGIVIYDGYRE